MSVIEKQAIEVRLATQMELEAALDWMFLKLLPLQLQMLVIEKQATEVRLVTQMEMEAAVGWMVL